MSPRLNPGVAIGVGVVIHFAMKWLDKRNPHTQRITIVSMAFCFAMAYIAEQYFGIADITGAYIAGIVLCAMDDAPYVERRVDISNYVIFAPVFFASIGLKTDISGLTPEILLFCICFVIVALLTRSSAAVWPRKSAASTGAIPSRSASA